MGDTSPVYRMSVKNRETGCGTYRERDGIAESDGCGSPLNYRCVTGLYYRNFVAIGVGVGTAMILNALTPIDFFRGHRVETFLHREWLQIIFIILAVASTGTLLQWRAQLPIHRMALALRSGAPLDERLRQRGQRRLLNIPYLIAAFNLSLWLIVPGVLHALFLSRAGGDVKLLLFLYFRALMVGMVSSAFAFFYLEDYTRRWLIPAFFPHGRLTEVKGTFRIPIFRRIRVLYMAGTSVPMAILVGTLAFSLWTMHETSLTARQFGWDFFIFTIMVCAIFVVLALRFNFLVGRSIQEPLQSVVSAVTKVKEGDFSRKIEVVSNDELGLLGDATNDMIRALGERERIREAFGRYVTPEIRDEILANRIPLDGELREATVLFSDLRGFTPFVENNTPEEVIQGLRGYFTAMHDAIRVNNGLVLQFVGDEVEAVFGVPLFYEDHADRAVEAALEMRRKLQEFNRLRLADGKSTFHHGVGIHTGTVLAGNTGSREQHAYALIGDTVNLGSRIQDLTKGFGCDILISEETVTRLSKPFGLEKLDPLMVKGYSKPVTIFRLA